MMPRKPIIRKHNEAAPEIVALDQPGNSANNGLKKTPKLQNVPCDTAIIKKAAKTMI